MGVIRVNWALWFLERLNCRVFAKKTGFVATGKRRKVHGKLLCQQWKLKEAHSIGVVRL